MGRYKLSPEAQFHRRPDLTDADFLFWPIYSYLLIYKPDTKPLEVVAIPSAYQDIERLLPKE